MSTSEFKIRLTGKLSSTQQEQSNKMIINFPFFELLKVIFN